MRIALCYHSVLPARGGCETYIADLSRRLARDGHSVHLYACQWDAGALPLGMHYHRITIGKVPRFLRPWRFAQACEEALQSQAYDVTMGFDKTWGQDILYPQGGVHRASAAHNLLKFRSSWLRRASHLLKYADPASWSFAWLEQKQYCPMPRPRILVNSRMVRGHFEQYYDIAPEQIEVLPSAIDPNRFAAADRPARRDAQRAAWNVEPETPVGLFVAMNYRLKGLKPLLYALARVAKSQQLHLAVVGNPRLESYQRLAHQLNIADRVRFLGFRASPRDAYFAADFLVHPTFYDPCSLVVLEGLACGLPIITTRYNGAAELMSPPAEGIVIDDPHHAGALAEALGRMTDSSYRQSCSQQARRTASRWTFEEHYQRLLKVFEQVARQRLAA